MPRDYYEVLGVDRTASQPDIKRAFYRLARETHPDVSNHPDAEARFKEINEAYEILSDSDKRARYDRFGHAGVQGAAGAGNAYSNFTGFDDFFEDFFSSFVGRSAGGTRQGPRAGADVRIEVVVDFEEAVFGVDKEVEFRRLEECDVCQGTGAREGSAPQTCPQCKGQGEVRQVRQTFIGSMVHVAPCPNCGGRGTIIQSPCTNCDGSGRRRRITRQNIRIPAGVYDGLRIQLRGEGDAGDVNAPPGNLLVLIRVRDHAIFKREESDIILDWTINVAQAALGDTIVVPTVEGDTELTIPPGTQTGKVFRLRGKGFPRLRTDGTSSGRGDQRVYIQVTVPTRLTGEQRELFERLGETLGKEIQPQAERGFFDRMMDFVAGKQQ
jgi:molecular chaperone DnaJ